MQIKLLCGKFSCVYYANHARKLCVSEHVCVYYVNYFKCGFGVTILFVSKGEVQTLHVYLFGYTVQLHLTLQGSNDFLVLKYSHK